MAEAQPIRGLESAETEGETEEKCIGDEGNRGEKVMGMRNRTDDNEVEDKEVFVKEPRRVIR